MPWSWGVKRPSEAHWPTRASYSGLQSLHGFWRAEHLFARKQALALFDFYGTQLAECDPAFEAQLLGT